MCILASVFEVGCKGVALGRAGLGAGNILFALVWTHRGSSPLGKGNIS